MQSKSVKWPTPEYDSLARVIFNILDNQSIRIVDLQNQLYQMGYNNGDQIQYVIDTIIVEQCYRYDPQTDYLSPGQYQCQF